MSEQPVPEHLVPTVYETLGKVALERDALKRERDELVKFLAHCSSVMTASLLSGDSDSLAELENCRDAINDILNKEYKDERD